MENVDPQGGNRQRNMTNIQESQRSRTNTEDIQKIRTNREDREKSRTITFIFPGAEGLKPSMKKPARTRPSLNRSLIRI